MADVIFEDFTIEVQGMIDDAVNITLEECAGELVSAVKRSSRKDTSETRNSFRHKVDKSSHTAYIGSDEENAIWEEFGTGEHALEGKGRKGYWVFVKGQSGGNKKSLKSYSLKEAKQVMAILRSKGLEAYYTNGKEPSRAFYNSYQKMKPKIIKRFQTVFKGMFT